MALRNEVGNTMTEALTQVTTNATDLAQSIISGTMTLTDLAQIADGSLEAQAVFTKVRVLAERQIAQQFLFDPDEHTASEAELALTQRGWTAHRIRTAMQYVQLSIIDLEAYTVRAVDAGKEASTAAIRALTPIAEKPERKTLAAAYTTPPIDVQIAREFGLEASDHRAEMLTQSIHTALHDMPNPKHAYVWAKYHGIQDDGTIGDRWTYQGIAASMADQAVTREYVESLYYRASSQVFQRIAVDALNQLALMQ